MILHTEKRRGPVPQALVGLVIQVHVRHLYFIRWQRFGIHAESVILGGDFHLIGQENLHGMI